MVGMNSIKSKEYFPKWLGHAQLVASNKSINQVVADNVTFWMKERDLSPAELAKAAGVDGKTVWNFLNPDGRIGEDVKKPPSGTLTSLQKIAEALKVQPHLLTRDPDEAALYGVIEDAVKRAMALQTTPTHAKSPTQGMHRLAKGSKVPPVEDDPAQDRKAS